MGKFFMWGGIVIGGAFIILFMFSTMAPQPMADFFMSFGAGDYEIELDGKEYAIRFDELGDGVEREERLFIMKKMIALHVLVEYEPKYNDELTAFNEALIAASEDHTLTSNELLELKNLCKDFMPEERVNNWIGMAKDLEEQKEMREREER